MSGFAWGLGRQRTEAASDRYIVRVAWGKVRLVLAGAVGRNGIGVDLRRFKRSRR